MSRQSQSSPGVPEICWSSVYTAISKTPSYCQHRKPQQQERWTCQQEWGQVGKKPKLPSSTSFCVGGHHGVWPRFRVGHHTLNDLTNKIPQDYPSQELTSWLIVMHRSGCSLKFVEAGVQLHKKIEGWRCGSVFAHHVQGSGICS